ncbi:MAG: response regulator transcription factor [Acidimicrobiia bacterium]
MGMGSCPSLLLVEDDTGIAVPLTAALRREGYAVEWSANGKDALARVSIGSFDAVVLDIGLPELDGLEVCREARRHGVTAPVLMLTARAEELDAIVGLDAGADDYVAKPVRPAELMARLRALLRRSAAPPSASHRSGTRPARGLEVDHTARRAWLDGAELVLTPKEFDLLGLFDRHRGEALTRERIMEEVWDEHWFGSTKTLDIHMSMLRRKLGDRADAPRFISTIRGVGFRFEAR